MSHDEALAFFILLLFCANYLGHIAEHLRDIHYDLEIIGRKK